MAQLIMAVEIYFPCRPILKPLVATISAYCLHAPNNRVYWIAAEHYLFLISATFANISIDT